MPITQTFQRPRDGMVLHKWEAIGNAESGAAVDVAEYADRSVHFFGTWGGATLVIEGTLDGTNWVTLNDAQGNPLSKSANGVEQVLETCLAIRPTTSGGTATSLTVTLLAKSGHVVPRSI